MAPESVVEKQHTVDHSRASESTELKSRQETKDPSTGGAPLGVVAVVPVEEVAVMAVLEVPAVTESVRVLVFPAVVDILLLAPVSGAWLVFVATTAVDGATVDVDCP